MTCATSPRVAFGLRAATVAIKARAGHRVHLAEVVDLAGYWRAVAPEDAAPGSAVARFLAEMHDTPEEAGAHLLDFIEAWVAGPGAEARRAETIISAAGAEVRALPEWTRRADCGID